MYGVDLLFRYCLRNVLPLPRNQYLKILTQQGHSFSLKDTFRHRELYKLMFNLKKSKKKNRSVFLRLCCFLGIKVGERNR